MQIPESENNIFLVLDIGTSDIKCACVDSENNILAGYHRKFPMETNEHFVEIDFDLFFNETMQLLKECLADKKVNHFEIEALLITSQAQTFAPVDVNFKPLRPGIVWLDVRAEKEADFLHEQFPEFEKTAGLLRPLPAQYITKLLWLKQNELAVFKKAHAFPLIYEYLACKLTDEFYSDSTGFGMGGLFDFRRNGINTELLQILGLSKIFFPKIEKAAVRGELISKHIQQEWNFLNRFPVYLCGNDQGASACGAGLKMPGDVSINFGSAMVFYTITEFLTTNLTDDQIAGKYPVANDYFLLNVESDFGIQIRRLKDNFFQVGTYDQLFQTYYDYPLVDEKAPPSAENDLKLITPSDSHQFCAGIIKYYLNRLKMHYIQISKTIELKSIYISGGMTQSKVWLEILGSALNRPFIINNQANAGIFGAIEIYLNANNK